VNRFYRPRLHGWVIAELSRMRACT
jgi:hypothetical protein